MSLVTVVIPVKDRREPLLRALRSVERQTFRDMEIIVVDDHSETEIENLLPLFKSDLASLSKFPPLPLRLIKSEGHGVSAARNSALRLSDSEFIALLDSDDEWKPEKIAKQVEFLKEHPHLPLVHTEEIWIRNGVRVNPMKKHKKSGGRIFTSSIKLCLISPSSVLIRRSLFDEVGLFDESFVVCEDYELWLRVTSLYEVGFLEEPLTIKYGGHDDQLSRRYHSMDLWRVRALRKYVDHPRLSEAEKQSVRNELRFKCEVLLKGFEKHRNFEHQDEVTAIYDRIQQAPPAQTSRTDQ